MALKNLLPAPTIKCAAQNVRTYLLGQHIDPKEDFCLKVELQNTSFSDVFANIRGLARSYFKSRDSGTEIAGLGVAETIPFSELCHKTPLLVDDQCYIGASRFDQKCKISKEWAEFGQHYYILPILTLVNRAGNFSLLLSFRANGTLRFQNFLDQAITLLCAIEKPACPELRAHSFCRNEEMPKRIEYFAMIEKALGIMESSPLNQKVVLGRRNTLLLDPLDDSHSLFSLLAKKSDSAFLFWLDNGKGSSFFGASPELLYERRLSHFATESLAGTRARGENDFQDDLLRLDLCQSSKDRSEHALVSEHIELSLKKLGVWDIRASEREVMALSYVQHLVKRYRATINTSLSDEAILQALHPTPAVSGLSREWALDFIREHEGFDRGFYAGPIGYIHRDSSEFAVGIRSALLNKQELHVYAASGIVLGSKAELEWEELNNKQWRILSIFED